MRVREELVKEEIREALDKYLSEPPSKLPSKS